MAKQKAVMAMGESPSDIGAMNVGRHAQQRRSLARMLNSLSFNPEGVVVILDDDVYQFEGNQGAFKQPTVQANNSLKPTPHPFLIKWSSRGFVSSNSSTGGFLGYCVL